MASSSSSSPPLAPQGWTYDVFLNFRGEDTRYTFIDHLYTALIQRGIRVYKDDETLHRGKPISPELLKSIEESTFAVVVLSENYVNSSWCLEELAKIMECHDRIGLKVLPVFYYVDPSDVRKQIGDFSFEKHEKKFMGEMDKIEIWKKALSAAANLSGFPISKTLKEGESSIITKIAMEILGGIQNRGMEKNLIGIRYHIDELNKLLDMEATSKVRIVGIYGMGGIGKTTIARALFKRISYKFEGSSFAKGVRENSNRVICELQRNILKDILGVDFKIRDPEDGADIIQRGFCNKKVLLVLDDVDDGNQLELLAATHEWFGPGSRIIITTRDEHLLSDANGKYKPGLLRMDQAIELFSWHAFRKNRPPDGYYELSNRAIRCTGRLPLALKVLGSFFRGRQAVLWESAIDRIAKTPISQIFETLKLSFDGLHNSEKEIFLDIACFFKGREVKDVTRVLDCFGFNAPIGISILVEKSLISISNEKLDMHDLIQEMGWQIVRENFPNSRLWQIEQIRDSIKEKRELEKIEAIVVPGNQYDVDLGFSADVFESMKNLRLLHVNRKFTCAVPTCLPNKLQSLCWNDYPFSSLPLAHIDKLVGLKIFIGRIQYLWEGQKIMLHLRFIHLTHLECLSSFPDVSGAPNIKRLILSSCDDLLEVHESLGSLRNLVYLNLNNCWKLKRLPARFEMESLETLNLSFCISLERFPEFSPCMVKLSHIYLPSCYELKELPSSIRYLSNLNLLNLRGCSSLDNIPNSIYELKNLKNLFLEDCPKLQTLPEVFGSLENLDELELGVRDHTSINFKIVPGSINMHAFTNLCSLRKLDLNLRQIGDEDFPNDLHGLSSLEKLNLSGNKKLTQLPVSISHLSHLKHLELDRCNRLKSLHGLPSGLEVLKANYCRSLEKIDDLSNDHDSLYKIWFLDCHKLVKDEDSKRYLDKLLKQSFLKKWTAAVDGSLSVTFPGSKIPRWLKRQQHGDEIELKLHSEWQTQIMGFVICGLFPWQESYNHSHSIKFIFCNEGMLVHEAEVDCIKVSKVADGGNVWLGYIPFSFLHQRHKDHECQDDDWFSITQGNVFITVGTSNYEAVRCGAQVVYKEEVEAIQQMKPFISYCWNWEIDQSNQTIIICDDKPPPFFREALEF